MGVRKRKIPLRSPVQRARAAPEYQRALGELLDSLRSADSHAHEGARAALAQLRQTVPLLFADVCAGLVGDLEKGPEAAQRRAAAALVALAPADLDCVIYPILLSRDAAFQIRALRLLGELGAVERDWLAIATAMNLCSSPDRSVREEAQRLAWGEVLEPWPEEADGAKAMPGGPSQLSPSRGAASAAHA